MQALALQACNHYKMTTPNFRDLYCNLLNYQGEDPYHQVLIPWQDRADEAMSRLNKYRNVETKNWHRKDILEDLLALYALSRVSDILLLPFQTGSHMLYEVRFRWVNNRGEAHLPPSIRFEERSEYLILLGMRLIEEATFHPFFHEIVEVLQSPEPSEPISLVEIIWPGFMLGKMIFCRAGVKVRGGTNYIKKEIAENSTLYFTFMRQNRPVSDLSHGWGSNSQWCTEFRRDYEDDSALYYNVDSEDDVFFPAKSYGSPNPARESITSAERIELLVNRCFIVTDKSHEDLWPYGDRYTEPKTT